MRTPPTLLADAVAYGVVDPADVISGAAVVRPVSGSNLVHRVDRDGLAVAYVKQAGAASVLDGDDSVAVEARALRRLARLHRPGSVLVPQLITHQIDGSEAEALWTTPVAGVELAALADRPGLLDRTAAELGRILARLHRPTPDTRPARRPWPLLPRRAGDAALPSMAGARPETLCANVLAVADTHPIRTTLADAADHWRLDIWMHGDLSAANVLVSGGPRLRIGLIDLESAGAGDPGWDLVCAAAALDSVDQRTDRPSTEALLEAYLRAGGPGRPTAALWCARDVMTAWQVAAMTHRDERPADPAAVSSVRHLLDRCRAHAARHLTTSQESR